MIRRIYRFLRTSIFHYLIPESRARIFAQGRTGIEVIGFFHSPSGIGESARLCARQLEQAGYKVLCTSVEKLFLKPQEITWDFKNTATKSEIGCRIIHLNPPMIPPVVFKIGYFSFAQVFNIGYWAWELQQIPAEWKRALRYINAVFCPSSFTAQAISNCTDKPVLTVPHPVSVSLYNPSIRKKLNIPDDSFMVSSIFSFGSALERKNPYATMEAFLKAFPDNKNVYLVFKCSHGENTEDKRIFTERIMPHQNIMMIDAVWDREDILGLIQTSNAYLSLHRSEGFGLTLGEAMLLGTPVIATNWSGNTDFCNIRNSFPVEARMIPVQSRHAEFSGLSKLFWADADIPQASKILYDLFKDSTEAKNRVQTCLDETNIYFSQPHYIQALHILTERAHDGS